jgi:hypothetical protein
MNYPIDWQSDKAIRNLFSYQARTGIAPAFGSCPVGPYQTIQCRAYDVIVTAIKNAGLTMARVVCKKSNNWPHGYFYAVTDSGRILEPLCSFETVSRLARRVS